MKTNMPIMATPITVTNTATAAALDDGSLPLGFSVVTLRNDMVVVDRSMECVDEDQFDFGITVGVDEMDVLLITDWWTDDAATDDDDNDDSVAGSRSFKVIVLLFTCRRICPEEVKALWTFHDAYQRLILVDTK